MAKPVFELSDAGEFRIVKFEIPGGVTTPVEFAEAVAEIAEELPGARVTLLNGRGPVWGFGMVIHAAHPTPAIATYDPRLNGAGGYVVVATHTKGYAVGDVIADPEA